MECVEVRGVNVLRWNPTRPFHGRPRRLLHWTARLPFAPRVGNFGDILGVRVVRDVASERLGPHSYRGSMPNLQRPRLAAVGSVMHMLTPGTTVWGCGVNGKSLSEPLPPELDIRAVRGPLTREYLLDRGVSAPATYGDPGLLLARYWDRPAPQAHGDVVVIQNMNDCDHRKTRPWRVVSPLSPLETVVDAIRGASLVVGSSLHALIIADSFGIPARGIHSSVEPRFKYADYYAGTGRHNAEQAASISEAIEMGGVQALDWDATALLDAFPSDIFTTVA